MSGNGGGVKWAVLVAVDFYIRGAEGPRRTSNLNGCVKDILDIEKYLMKFRGAKKENIIKLTSTLPPGYDEEENDPIGMMPAEKDGNDWPTYLNIKHALERISRDPEVKEGDIVYFHYSGHGSRTKNGTMYPKWKGPAAQDESLVPTDALTAGKLLDDVTLAYLLEEIVKKKVKLTVVLDNCHSGGAVRAPGEKDDGTWTVRSTDIDPRQLPTPQIPAEDIIAEGDLFEAWKKQQARGGRVHKGAMVNPSGYQLFAACRAHEFAWGGKNGGVLTQHLIKALTENQNATQGMLLRRVDDDTNKSIELINNYLMFKNKPTLASQVPIMEGNNDSCFLSDRTGNPERPATTRLQVLINKVKLAAGESHGVTEGSVYAIYPWDASNLANPSAPRVTVTKVFPLHSEAKFQSEHERFPAGTAGCHAVLLEVPPDATRPSGIPDECPAEELAHITRFKTILGLKNMGSSLHGKFEMSILGPGTMTNGIYEIKAGEKIKLQLKSSAKEAVYMSCFYLGAQWSVDQIYPVNSVYDVMYEETRETPAFRVNGPDSSMDVIKCWITTRPVPTYSRPVVPSPVNFRTLEMRLPRAASVGYLTSDLASSWINEDNSSSGGSKPPPDISEGEWYTAQIMLRITR